MGRVKCTEYSISVQTNQEGMNLPKLKSFYDLNVLIYTVPEMYKADIRISTINVANCPLNVITFLCFLLVKVSFESPKFPFFFMSSSWLMIC